MAEGQTETVHAALDSFRPKGDVLAIASGR
jgi:hypothetical protein